MTLLARLAPLLLLPLAACSTTPRGCTLVGAPDGVVVDQGGLPAGLSGEVCVVNGPCSSVPTPDVPVVLSLPAEPATVTLEVRITGRPVERLSVPLAAFYPNGRGCGPADYQASVRLTAGATLVG